MLVVPVGSAALPEVSGRSAPRAPIPPGAGRLPPVGAQQQPAQTNATQTNATQTNGPQLKAAQTRHLEDLLLGLWPNLTSLGGCPLEAAPGTLDELLLDLDCGEDHLLVVRRRRLPSALSGLPMLSPRELAIARLVARGLPNKSIGHLLDISPWTVATHLRRIFGKLQVASRAAMVACLTRQHLL